MCKESARATEAACSPYNEKLGTLLCIDRKNHLAPDMLHLVLSFAGCAILGNYPKCQYTGISTWGPNERQYIGSFGWAQHDRFLRMRRLMRGNRFAGGRRRGGG